MSVRLAGPVVDVERKLMERTNNDTGEVIKVMTAIAYVLDGRYTRGCIVDDGYGPAPEVGDQVDAFVQVTAANNGRYNGLNWRLLKPAAEAAESTPSRAA